MVLAFFGLRPAGHVVSDDHSTTVPGKAYGEDRGASDERHRIRLASGVFIQALPLQHAAQARRAFDGDDGARTTDFDSLVRWNRQTALHFFLLAFRTDAIALRSACALLRVSSHSRSGTESATMPAPACTEAAPSAITHVRMVIARSMRDPPAAM